MIYILEELKYRPKSGEIEGYLLRKSPAVMGVRGGGGVRGGVRGSGRGKKTCSMHMQWPEEPL